MRSLKLVVIPFACLALIAGCGGKKEPAPPEEQPVPPLVETPPPTPPPQETETPRTEPAQLNLENVYFDYDRYELREDARATLANNAKQLESNAAARVSIEGHCDERGTTEYNLALGEKRAQAARDYLVNYGIGADRLTTVSFGEERPVDPGHDESAWAKNRRAAFVVK
jgi:peptidoglycan-associated lipoprotein